MEDIKTFPKNFVFHKKIENLRIFSICITLRLLLNFIRREKLSSN